MPKYALASLLVLVLILAIPCYPVSSAGWLSNWLYRKPITISNSGGALSNYQIQITVDTASLISAGKMRSDCGDIRFTDSDGTTLLSYYIESGVNTASTKIWVLVPSIPSGSKTIYMYYGNPSATSQSNPNNVFIFYDDFSTLDTSKWGILEYPSTGEVSVYTSNGQLVVSMTSSSTSPAQESGRIFLQAYTLESAWYLKTGETYYGPYIVHTRAYRSYAGGYNDAYDAGDELGVFVAFSNNPAATNRPTYLDYASLYYDSFKGGLAVGEIQSTLASFTTGALTDYASNVWYTIDLYYINGQQLKAVFYRESDGRTVTLTYSSPSLSPDYIVLGYEENKPSNVYALFDLVYVRKYASPEPTTSVGAEQTVPPTVKAYSASYTYSYGGSYQVYADACNVNTVTFNSQSYDSYTSINSTCNRYYKTFRDLPAGTYTITVSGSSSTGSVSSTATLTINKASLSGSISAPAVTYPSKLAVTASKSNKGDNDVQYQITCGSLTVSGLSAVFDLPAGSYTCVLKAPSGGQNYSASSSIASVSTSVAKGTPSLSLSVKNGTWALGGNVSASESNKGDNDVQYTVYLCDSSGYCTALGGIGTYTITNKPSGIYTLKLTSSGGQNWTSASITKTLEIKQAWEKTSGIYANQSYKYDYNKQEIPIKAYYKFRPANTTVYVNKPLYIYSLVNVTNEDSIIRQAFTNVMVNVSVKGFKQLNTCNISYLGYGQTAQCKLFAKSLCAYEKNITLSIGHATYTISVNSSFVKDLPVVYVLPKPPNWTQKISFNITVDGKTKGFSFDPDTLTLVISTSFSQSSLETGDHTVDLYYALPSPDLTVKSIEAPSTILRAPQVNLINVTIANIGGADVTQPFKVYLYADNSLIDNQTVSGLNAGETKKITFSWSPLIVKDCVLKAVVDPDNVIKESNEANNQLTLRISVVQPVNATSPNATSGAPSQPSGAIGGGIPLYLILIPIFIIIFIILMLLLRRRSKRRATWLKK